MSGTASISTSNHLDKRTVLIAAFAIGNAGLLMIYLLPLLVGAVNEQLLLNERQTGIFASSDLIGYSIASISAFFWIRRINWKHAAFVGLCMIIIGNLLSPLMSGYWNEV